MDEESRATKNHVKCCQIHATTMVGIYAPSIPPHDFNISNFSPSPTTLGRQSTNCMACKGGRVPRSCGCGLPSPDFGDVSALIGREISSPAPHSFPRFAHASKFIMSSKFGNALWKNGKQEKNCGCKKQNLSLIEA